MAIDMTSKDLEQQYPPLDAQQADALLDRLATDDEFRQLFCKDGPAALAAIGFAGSTVGKTCFKVENLASKQEFVQARDALRQALTSKAQMSMSVVFFFEAGKLGLPQTKR